MLATASPIAVRTTGAASSPLTNSETWVSTAVHNAVLPSTTVTAALTDPDTAFCTSGLSFRSSITPGSTSANERGGGWDRYPVVKAPTAAPSAATTPSEPMNWPKRVLIRFTIAPLTTGVASRSPTASPTRVPTTAAAGTNGARLGVSSMNLTMFDETASATSSSTPALPSTPGTTSETN